MGRGSNSSPSLGLLAAGRRRVAGAESAEPEIPLGNLGLAESTAPPHEDVRSQDLQMPALTLVRGVHGHKVHIVGDLAIAARTAIWAISGTGGW